MFPREEGVQLAGFPQVNAADGIAAVHLAFLKRTPVTVAQLSNLQSERQWRLTEHAVEKSHAWLRSPAWRGRGAVAALRGVCKYRRTF